jgi:CBS domain-containing protein/gamma-glutamyl:cysteine ligase YbdK (ATP-grasp superfamily)
MGEQQVRDNLGGDARHSFVRALLRDLRALSTMIDKGMIEKNIRRIGAEQEVFLINHSGHPTNRSLDLLAQLNDPHYTTELALFNLEINLDPLLFENDVLSRLEANTRGLLDRLTKVASANDVQIALCGILPTIDKSDLDLDSMTPLPRYEALNRVLGDMRGGPYDFRISGDDELGLTHDNVMLESCNCSFQLHFQVAPDEFPHLYNVAQVVAAPVLAAACNSPMLFGRKLWHETRIALLQQSIDTRRSHHHLRDRSPRVTFGHRWVRDSVLELFQEDVARFRAIFGTTFEEDPFEQLAKGEAPQLNALRLHNGTVYRWNRACYGTTNGVPHLRIENRILPAGPTLRDEIANAALWFGLISGLSHSVPDIPAVFEFKSARGNFRQAARYGLSAQFEWLDGQHLPAQRLLLERLLPLAREGLQEKKVRSDDIELYLGVIAQRVRSGQTGARWQRKSLRRLQKDRKLSAQLADLTLAMVKRQRTEKPVSEWSLVEQDEQVNWKRGFMRVEQVMTTDLITVQQDEPIELVAQLMDWERVRHIPVEDDANQLVGLMSYRTILRVLARGGTDTNNASKPVSSFMNPTPHCITPDALTLDAMRLMRQQKIGCLPVLEHGKLVGLVTERDFMDVASWVMEEQLAEESSREQLRRNNNSGEMRIPKL